MVEKIGCLDTTRVRDQGLLAQSAVRASSGSVGEAQNTTIASVPSTTHPRLCPTLSPCIPAHQHNSPMRIALRQRAVQPGVS